MREFRCYFTIEWNNGIDNLANKLSENVLGGIPFNNTDEFQCPGKVLSRKLFGFNINLSESTKNKYRMEIQSEYPEFIKYTEEEKIAQEGLRKYISQLLNEIGLIHDGRLFLNKRIE